MKKERKFLRQCTICREYKPKDLLIRITKNYKTSEYIINSEGDIYGRSIYVCKEKECIAKLVKDKKKQRIVGLKVIEDIERIINEQNNCKR